MQNGEVGHNYKQIGPALGLQVLGGGGGGGRLVLVDCFPQLVFNCVLSSCNTAIKMCEVQLANNGHS